MCRALLRKSGLGIGGPERKLLHWSVTNSSDSFQAAEAPNCRLRSDYDWRSEAMQVARSVVRDCIGRRRLRELQVSQLVRGVQLRVLGSWGSDAGGAFREDCVWGPWDRGCGASGRGVLDALGTHCVSSIVEIWVQESGGGMMASQVFSCGSMLTGITCTAVPGLFPVLRSSSSRSFHSSMSKLNRRFCFETQHSPSRGMRSSAVAEPDFSEKRDEVQLETVIPVATRSKADAAVVKPPPSTSALPESRIVHETAIVHPGAFVGEGVVIGAFCTVGPGVSLGYGCKLHPGSHVCGNTELGEGCEVMNGAVVGADIAGRTVIGNQNTIGYHAVVGIKCQDMKYKEGDECYLHIGNNNDIREYASVHRSSKPNDCTVIGDNNLIMGSCHVAHDCKLGNHNILANATLIGGHVILEDYIHTGGAVAIHQHCHIDSYSFLAGGSMVTRDVPMYMMVSGDRAELRGLNLEGLRRLGFSDLEVKSIRRTYQKLFMSSDLEAGGLEDRLAELEANEELAEVPAVVAMLRSVRACFGEKRRGICMFRHWTSV